MLCSLTALSCSRDGEGASISVKGIYIIEDGRKTQCISHALTTTHALTFEFYSAYTVYTVLLYIYCILTQV